MRIVASTVARITSGNLVGPDSEAIGLSFDSRALVDGQMFVALSGERDGHEFLQDALDRGAACAIVEKGRAIAGLTCIEVEDTLIAIAQLASALRESLTSTVESRVVGITGSAGKTSTKDFVHAVLASTYFFTHSSTASLNNDIGVPATIINAPDSCDALVLEMGMRGFGEIARLCSIAQPCIGVVTNIGDAHSERVGGIGGVAKAKFELLQSLPHDGVAIVNADDSRSLDGARALKCQVVTFGESSVADVRWRVDGFDIDGASNATFTYRGEEVAGLVLLPGQHMVANAAAAVAVGLSCGISLSKCVAALAVVKSQPGRMQWRQGRQGLRILDDTYNANSLSMVSALRTLARGGGRKIAVLGAMSEVADHEATHRAVAAEAHSLGIELLPCETELYGQPALSIDDIVKHVSRIENVSVLVKGSRVAATERVVEKLLQL